MSRFVFTALASASLFMSGVVRAESSSADSIQELQTLPFSSPELTQAITLLRQVIESVESAIPDSLKPQLEGTLHNRLQDIRAMDETHITREYQAAVAATRLAELCRRVAGFSGSQLPDPHTLHQAAGQIEDLTDMLRQPSAAIHPEVHEIAAAPALRVLDRYAWDFFSVNYGRPLTDAEFETARRLITNLVSDMSDLSGEFDNVHMPGARIQDAAEIGIAGGDAVNDYFLNLPPARTGPLLELQLPQEWHDALDQLEAQTYSVLADAEEMEIVAVTERANLETARQIAENSPEAHEARRHAEQLDRHRTNERDLSQTPSKVRISLLVVLNVIVLIFVILYLRRRSG